jgi:hypothetical protein
MRAPTCEASTLSLATTPAAEATIERDCERSSAEASHKDWPSASAATVMLPALHRFLTRTIMELNFYSEKFSAIVSV